MRPSEPHASCDPPGSNHCGLLWILGDRQVGKSPAPALSLLLQSLSDDVFSCLLVTYRDAGQSSLLWRLPGGAQLPAPHAREAVAALPKASPSSGPADKREPCPSCLWWKGKELVWMLHLLWDPPRPDSCSTPRQLVKLQSPSDPGCKATTTVLQVKKQDQLQARALIITASPFP